MKEGDNKNEVTAIIEPSPSLSAFPVLSSPSLNSSSSSLLPPPSTSLSSPSSSPTLPPRAPTPTFLSSSSTPASSSPSLSLPYSLPGISYRPLLPPPPPSRASVTLSPSPLSSSDAPPLISSPSLISPPPIVPKHAYEDTPGRPRTESHQGLDPSDESCKGLCWGFWLPGFVLIVNKIKRAGAHKSYASSIGSSISLGVVTIILLMVTVIVSNNPECSGVNTCLATTEEGTAPADWLDELIKCNNSIQNNIWDFGQPPQPGEKCPVPRHVYTSLPSQSTLCSACICYYRRKLCSASRGTAGALWVVTGVVALIFVLNVLVSRRYRAKLTSVNVSPS